MCSQLVVFRFESETFPSVPMLWHISNTLAQVCMNTLNEILHVGEKETV